jgi:hypothetical protein
MKNSFLVLGFLAVLGTLCSCAARIDGALAANGSASLSVSMSLGQQTAALIQRLTAAGGQGGPVLDGPAISRSMAEAGGVASVTLRNTGPAAVEGQMRISAIGDFLAPANGRTADGRAAGSGFIEFEQSGSGGRCVINISRANGPVIIELLSPQIADFLNALMAPLATGEELSRAEYLELVASFYNNAVSDEIAGSRIRASIDFPRAVTSVRGGTFSGRRVNFDIPLLDLLVLETPLVYEVYWN